jgi:hypothetical protein
VSVLAPGVRHASPVADPKGQNTNAPRLLSADTLQTLRLQLVPGDDRAEVSLDDLKRLENRPLS